MGVVFGFFAGLGTCFAAEFLDPTVKDAEELRRLQPNPLLASIPHQPGL